MARDRSDKDDVSAAAAKMRAGRKALKIRPPPPDPEGRVAIEALSPRSDDGATPVKRIVGDWVSVKADIFSDGHETLAADVLYRPSAETDWSRAPMRPLPNDRWSGSFQVTEPGCWQWTIEAWRDPFASWTAGARKKIESASDDVALVALEGANLIGNIKDHAARLAMRPLCVALSASKGDTEKTLGALLSEEAQRLAAKWGTREDILRLAPLDIVVERQKARFSSWYELFPRSMSPIPGRHGSFSDVEQALPYVRGLGFDTVYFPPIHPIGRTHRKGRNNALKATASDLGSVYAIGSEEGGHESVHPELGTLADFRRLVATAHAQGLEVAIDFAVQCSPDHPWIKQHPEWFEWRPDGTIRYAENPPKRYEDIVNFRFDGAAFPAVWEALRDVVLFWIEQGVRIFRVDNPHTKPLPFWRWLISDVLVQNPEVIFLAEAFTRPKMMRALAKAGFQQSYTYFIWRNAKQELTEYVTELAGPLGEVFRPNFFVNTPDINPYYLQSGGRTAFFVRATLAATLSSSWGIYSGFELFESTPLPGREEYLDAEKYELRQRDFSHQTELAAHIRRLNEIRRDNPALHDFRNVLFTNAWNDQILAYLRATRTRDNAIFVLVNLDPHAAQETTYELPLWEFGLPDHASLEVEDLLLGLRFTMYGKVHRIRIDPAQRHAVIWRLLGPQRPEAAG